MIYFHLTVDGERLRPIMDQIKQIHIHYKTKPNKIGIKFPFNKRFKMINPTVNLTTTALFVRPQN